MKSKGVRITEIKKKDVDPGLKAARENIRESQPVRLAPPISARESSRTLSSTPRVPRSGSGKRKSWVIGLIIAIILGGGYWLAHAFQNIKISIMEKHQSFTLDHKAFTASSNSSAPVEFQIMIVSDDQMKDVTLTQSETVNIKAHGTITLYNEYSTKAQSLVIHSMVSDPNGKTYQTDKAVSIPGYKLDAAKKIIPGTIDVGITAARPTMARLPISPSTVSKVRQKPERSTAS